MFLVAALVSFIVAFIAELAFILQRQLAASPGTSGSPISSAGLIVWGFIGLGFLCCMIAAAILLISHFRNRL
jgi:hypothetical protein